MLRPQLWSLRSSFADLPDTQLHLSRAPRPVAQMPTGAHTNQTDHWLEWEFFDFDAHCRLMHAAEAKARNVSVPFLPFADLFRRVFDRNSILFFFLTTSPFLSRMFSRSNNFTRRKK